MTSRSYDQYCGLARALDLVGERWTLLIVRDLSSGPRRYTDLRETLSGCGTSILASRLRQLEQGGVVTRRRLPPPAASDVYELTEAGRELSDAILPLVAWGIRHALGARRDDDAFHAVWPLQGLRAFAGTEVDDGVEAVVQFRLDGSDAYLTMHDGHLDVYPGTSPTPPSTTVTASVDLMLDLALGSVDPATALGDLQIEGDPLPLQTLITMLPAVTTALNSVQPPPTRA